MDDVAEDDHRLLAEAAGGCERSFRVLVERHLPLCRRRAYDVLRDAALAEDAVQEAFVDLWRTASVFDASRASVRTWLCVLVHRRAVDIARREARRRRTQAVDADRSLDPASYTAEELLLLRVERRRVQAALAGLPATQRRLLELAYYGGLTQSQLATRLEVPLGTVKSRMRDALMHLRDVLGPAEPAAE